jgi:hypothetical protein
MEAVELARNGQKNLLEMKKWEKSLKKVKYFSNYRCMID